MSYIWLNQYFNGSNRLLLNTIDTIFKDQYKQIWIRNVSESPKCLNYRMYKHDHKIELYTHDLIPKSKYC